ncbi:MAG: diaminopimelate epimerase [Nitrospinota bacterium]|nr:diaminopimelate epimerase [Nitrospinota bacterium]
MATIKFVKMHGLGNDFVMIDSRRKPTPGLKKKAVAIADRHFGVGCDQIIELLPSKKADWRMRIFNADGGEVEMCGNGIRAFAKYLWDRKDRKIRSKGYLTVETLAGIIKPVIKKNGMVEVDMGEPVLDGRKVPTIFDGPVQDLSLKAGSDEYKITAVSMGNPHCVIFTDDVDKVELEKVGPLIERHEAFPNRINVEFVQVISKNRVKARVWERGSGITLACGTGACAVGVAFAISGGGGRKTRVDLPGGSLEIEWTKENRVLMTGPATEVFSGVMDI